MVQPETVVSTNHGLSQSEAAEVLQVMWHFAVRDVECAHIPGYNRDFVKNVGDAFAQVVDAFTRERSVENIVAGLTIEEAQPLMKYMAAGKISEQQLLDAGVLEVTESHYVFNCTKLANLAFSEVQEMKTARVVKHAQIVIN